MTQESDILLKTSKDPKKLLAAALGIANGTDPKQHEALRTALQTADFHARLAKEEDARFPARDQKVRRILAALAKNSLSAAKETLLSLTENQTFNAVAVRTECLIECTSELRPPTAGLIDFWARHFQPDDGFTSLTVKALFENGTKESLALFADRMLDPSHDEDDRKVWLRYHVFPRRNDVLVLTCAQDLLSKKLSAPLKSELIDVLFDNKSAIWFTPAHNVNPPPLTAYSEAARQILRTLGRRLIDEKAATPDQRLAIEKTLTLL